MKRVAETTGFSMVYIILLRQNGSMKCDVAYAIHHKNNAIISLRRKSTLNIVSCVEASIGRRVGANLFPT